MRIKRRITGYRHNGKTKVFLSHPPNYEDEVEITPEYSQSVCNHSPDGFSWGYHGSGCAQLALAILLKFLVKEDALTYYQTFKSEVISKLQGRNFEFYFDDIIIKDGKLEVVNLVIY